MTPALLELLLRSLRGRFRRWFRLLRQPKYSIGFALGLLYFVWIFASVFPGGSIDEIPPPLLKGLEHVLFDNHGRLANDACRDHAIVATFAR